MRRLILVLLLLWQCAAAHVNSPDVFVHISAGPYPLDIAIRPPDAIPGTAQIEVRATSETLTALRVSPLPLTGDASRRPPAPEPLIRSEVDGKVFSGSVWIMATGAWQIRFYASGLEGNGDVSVPLPAASRTIKPLSAGLSILLSACGLLLFASAISIIGATAREAQLEPGKEPGAQDRVRGRIVMMAACIFLLMLCVGGATWWRAEAASYSRGIYRPLQLSAELRAEDLRLQLRDANASGRRVDDLIPDHGHLMHLYALRMPEMDQIYHLHPEQSGKARFDLMLPNMPGGEYRIFADIVHADGFPETLSALVRLPAVTDRALVGDDAGGEVTSLTHASDANTYLLPDGYQVRWLRPLRMQARHPLSLQFEVVNAQGQPATDLSPYMGMAGHAAIVKHDGTVFAHIHPVGTVNMAALMLAQNQSAGEHHHDIAPDALITFPYGFPSPGAYRVVLQFRHSEVIETAVFDANIPR